MQSVADCRIATFHWDLSSLGVRSASRTLKTASGVCWATMLSSPMPLTLLGTTLRPYRAASITSAKLASSCSLLRQGVFPTSAKSSVKASEPVASAALHEGLSHKEGSCVLSVSSVSQPPLANGALKMGRLFHMTRLLLSAGGSQWHRLSALDFTITPTSQTTPRHRELHKPSMLDGTSSVWGKRCARRDRNRRRHQ